MAEDYRARQTVRTASGASSPSTSFRTPKQEVGSVWVWDPPRKDRNCLHMHSTGARLHKVCLYDQAQTIFRVSRIIVITSFLESPRGLFPERTQSSVACLNGNSAVVEPCLLAFWEHIFRCSLEEIL